MQEVYRIRGNGRKAVVYLTPNGAYTVVHYRAELYLFKQDFTTIHRRSAEVEANNYVKYGHTGRYKLKLNRKGN
jgi:hypothetical protein